MTGLLDLATYLPEEDSVLPNPSIVYPTMAEGFDWNIDNPLERYFTNTSLYLPLDILHVPHKRAVLVLGLLAMVAYLSLLVLRQVSKRAGKEDIGYVFLFGTLMCLLGDFFIPIPRYPYYDIQMLLPLLVIISQANPKYIAGYRGNITLALAFFLSAIGFFFVPKALFLAGFLIAFYVVALSISVLRQHRACLRLSAQS